MGTLRTAQAKKNFIWSKVNSQSAGGLGYDEKKLVAELVLETNTTRRMAMELIKVFEDAEKIIRREGKIYSKAYYNDDLSFKGE